MGRDNLFRSTDAGQTWQPVPGQPTAYRPTHMALAPDGMLYLSYGDNPGPSTMTAGPFGSSTRSPANGRTFRRRNRTGPRKRSFGYAAVAVDAQHPRTIIASSFRRPNGAGGEDDMFRSIDAGKTWKAVFGGGGTFDNRLAPYMARTPIHWMFDIEIDLSIPITPCSPPATAGGRRST